MLDKKDMTVAAAVALRDEEGAIRPEFVEQVTAAIERSDAAALQGARGRPARGRHRRLDRGARYRHAAALRRADGPRVRLHGADRGRRHRPRGNPRRAAAGDRRRGRPRARFRRCGATSSRTCRRRSRPRSSSNLPLPSASRSSAASIIRKTPPAGACRPSSSRCRPTGPSARPSTICARRPTCRTGSGNSMSSIRRPSSGGGGARSAAADQAAGADRELMDEERWRVQRHRGPGGGGAHVRALQPGRGAGRGRDRSARRRDHLRRHRRRASRRRPKRTSRRSAA